MKIREDQGKSL